jgi:hypothetical protein
MREIKKYVRFYIQKRKTWTDQSPRRPRPVVMMFNYDGKRLCTLTGLKIAECDWDASKQRLTVFSTSWRKRSMTFTMTR